MMRKSQTIKASNLHYEKALDNTDFYGDPSLISKMQMINHVTCSRMIYAMASFEGSLSERPEHKFISITKIYAHANMKKLKNVTLHLMALNFYTINAAPIRSMFLDEITKVGDRRSYCNSLKRHYYT